MKLQYALRSDKSWQDMARWQTPDAPFMTFEFWQALSDTGAIGEQAGWLPIYVLIHRPNETDNVIDNNTNDDKNNAAQPVLSSEPIGQPIAVMPVFIKGHHQVLLKGIIKASSSLTMRGHKLMRSMVLIIIHAW